MVCCLLLGGYVAKVEGRQKVPQYLCAIKIALV